MKKYIIDRFEEEFAVCEDQETEEMIDILIERLPENVEEGDVIIEENDVFYIDHEETEARREQMQILLKKLLNKDSNENVEENLQEETEEDFDNEIDKTEEDYENNINEEGEEDAGVDEGTETSNRGDWE